MRSGRGFQEWRINVFVFYSIRVLSPIGGDITINLRKPVELSFEVGGTACTNYRQLGINFERQTLKHCLQ